MSVIIENQSPTNPDQYQEVEKPTWHEHIKFFFRPFDVEEMKKARGQNFRLDKYKFVKGNYRRIRDAVKVKPDGTSYMPCDLVWSRERVKTFQNWRKNDFAVGEAKPEFEPVLETTFGKAENVRYRRNIHKLKPEDEYSRKLIRAFKAIMKRSPQKCGGKGQKNSYFEVAGIHGLPIPFECRHKSIFYNPWHRVYMVQIEDALRSVPGCEDIALPYWDITDKSIPPILNMEPFAGYLVRGDLLAGMSDKDKREYERVYGCPYETKRNKPHQILDNLKSYDTNEKIAKAMQAKWFDTDDVFGFTDLIERAHDGGHLSIGKSMSHQWVASFDPIFWFFHSNWDRLWWSWQVNHQAKTLKTFKHKLQESDDWLDEPMKNGVKSADVIDIRNMKMWETTYTVTYEELISKGEKRDFDMTSQNLFAGASFRLPSQRTAFIKLKGIDRTKIKGSFLVRLLANEQEISREGFFQAHEPGKCPNCMEKPIVEFHFEVPLESLEGNIRFDIQPVNAEHSSISMEDLGDPVIEVKLMTE